MYFSDSSEINAKMGNNYVNQVTIVNDDGKLVFLLYKGVGGATFHGFVVYYTWKLYIFSEFSGYEIIKSNNENFLYVEFSFL